jgi:hypothetical protein
MVSKFTQYAAEGPKRPFLGGLIKFVKGDWQMGPDKDLISSVRRFVVVMDSLTTGHIKWDDGKPVDSRMGLVADGFSAVHRAELDDFDSKTWEVDKRGDRVDPWQKTDLLVVASETAPYDLFTFSTTSVGGQDAIRDLCEAHGRTTEGVGQYPVVTFGSDSYQHKDPRVGRVDVPVFKVVDSVEAAPFNAIVAEARGGAGFIPTSPPALVTSGMTRHHQRPRHMER